MRNRLAVKLFAAVAVLGAPLDAAAQDSLATRPALPAAARGRCRTAANPRNRSLDCNTGSESIFAKDEHALASALTDFRAWADRHGITPTLSLTTQPMATSATLDGGRDGTVVSQVNVGIAFDAGKASSARGLRLYLGMAYASGASLSDRIGSLYTVQSAAAGYGFWIGELYAQQTMDAGRFKLSAGRLSPGTSFAVLPVAYNYLNSAIAWGNPNALSIDDPAFTSFPVGIQWGVQGTYAISPEFELGAGFYNNNPRSTEGADHGFAGSFRDGNVGMLTVVRASWFRDHRSGAPGRAGQYSIGVYFDSNRFAELPSGADSTRGLYNTYAMFEQRVTGAPEDDRGLTVWSTVSYTSRTMVATMPVSWNAGLSFEGPFARRPSDIASLGIFYGAVSRQIPGASRELAIELNYQLAVTGWFTVMPDIQVISRPGGTSASLQRATLLGVHLSVVF
jgi:carbohydrate-selective porin OprB